MRMLAVNIAEQTWIRVRVVLNHERVGIRVWQRWLVLVRHIIAVRLDLLIALIQLVKVALRMILVVCHWI